MYLNKMTKFIKGKKLSELFFIEIVKPLLKKYYPNLKYSAGLLGHGSDVIDFDTPRSMDHDWGPRVLLFLSKEDFKKKKQISEMFSKELPYTFRGFSTHFGAPDEKGVKVSEKIKSGKIRHRIEIFSIESFFKEYLNFDIKQDICVYDWLLFPEQKLLTITAGKVFYDKLGLKKIIKKIRYFPKDVWYYLLVSQWTRISQEEHFMGRCGELNDEIGSKIIATRLVQSIMRLCFLMEKEYAPYSKWFGTAFAKLKSAKILTPIFHKIISSENWKEREKYLSKTYEIIANMHNELKITKQLSTNVTKFHDRPYLVIHGDIFAEEIKKQIKNKDIMNIKSNIGSVNQITNTVDLLENNELLQRMKKLYE